MEKVSPRDAFVPHVTRGGAAAEAVKLHGRYHCVCRDKDGNVKWEDWIENTVVTVGKNLALDTILGGSSYSVTGPYMGLISSSSWSAISASDTMSSHSGWTEAGNAHAPTYSGNRPTAVFSSASGGSKALSSALTFTFTGSGTVKGAFIVYGSGAVNTIDSTAGTLLSAGLFSGGDKTVASSDTLSVSWSLSM
jgi:hypothetical protein